LAFAKTKSDSVIALKDDKDVFETHKKQRKEHKLKQRREYMHQKILQKRAAEHGEFLILERSRREKEKRQLLKLWFQSIFSNPPFRWRRCNGNSSTKTTRNADAR